MPFSRLVASTKINQQVFSYLRGHPAGVSSSILIKSLLKLRRAPIEHSDALCDAILAEDPRFARNADGLWIVVPAPEITGSIWDRSYVALDIEATGTNPVRHRMIELGAVKYENGRAVEEYSTLLNPKRKIPPYIQKMTGISSHDVASAPSTEEIIDEFLDFLGDSIIVAHNAVFDRRFIRCEFALHGKPVFQNDSLCTLKMAQRLLHGKVTRFGLSQICDYFETPMEDQHRALADAEGCGNIFLHMLMLLESYGATDFRHLKQFEDSGKFDGMVLPPGAPPPDQVEISLETEA